MTLTAAGIASTLGAAVGLAVGLLPTLRSYVVASIDFLRTIPAVTLIPVAVLTFGPVATTELMLAMYAALWPVVLCTAAGRRRCTPTSVRHRANAAFLPRHHRSERLCFPRLCPHGSSVRVWRRSSRCLSRIVAEMIMYPRGLGGGLIESLNALAPARMWAYALVCGVIGFALNAVLRRASVSSPGSPANADGDRCLSEHGRTNPPRRLRGLLPVAAALVAWQLAATSDSLFFPPPSEWLKALGRLHGCGVLTPAVVQTRFDVRTRTFRSPSSSEESSVPRSARRVASTRALTPSIDFLAAIPGAAVVPVVVLLLGPNQLSGVVVVALIVSWPILLAAATAMRTVPAVRLEMSRTLGLTPLQRWSKVILPSLTPGVMLGVRVASAMALIVTLLVDIFGVGAGLGRLLIESQQRFESGHGVGSAVMIGAFGYLTSAFFAWLVP